MSDDARQIHDTLTHLGIRELTPADATIPLEPDATTEEPNAHLLTLRPEVLPRLDIRSDDAEFILLNEIGRGGMGVVHLVRQRSLQRYVVAKRLHEGINDPSTLLREALYSGTLEHPNIIPVHTVGTDPHGAPLFIMKHVDGVSWQTLLDDPHHPRWAQVHTDRLTWNLGVLSQLCNAIAYAHSRNILHRDIKPDNVMIGRFGEVYLLDWGVAIDMSSSSAASMAFAGTPAYMAPEMVTEGLGPLSLATDVFLLGATLHHALTGSPRNGVGSVSTVLVAAARAQPFDYDESIPAALAAICNRACARAPSARYANAEELQRALDEFLQNRASMELAEAARARLSELERRLDEGDLPSDTLYRLLNECRFGFEQALHGWPENAEARAGLQTALRRVILYEVRARNLGAATALAAELDPRPPDIDEALGALAAEVAAERERADADRRLAYELDITVGSRQRAIGGVLFTASVVVTFSAFVIGRTFDLFTFSYGISLIGPALGLLALLGTTIGWGGLLMRTRISRRAGATVLLLIIGILLNRGVGFWLNHPIDHNFVYDAVLYAVVAGFAGLTVHRSYWVGAAAALGATLTGMFLPELLPWSLVPFFAVGIGSALVSTFWISKRFQHETPGASGDV